MVCGLARFRSMALVNEVKRTGTSQNHQYIRLNGGMRKKGEGSLVAVQKGQTR